MFRHVVRHQAQLTPCVKQALSAQSSGRRIIAIQPLRSMSSMQKKKAADDLEEIDIDTKAKQPFATAKLEPGEWDPQRKDPLYRPKFKSNSKIISAEDFANRPPVTFGEEFSTYDDAMITLSWMDQATCRQIYYQYVDMMVLSHEKFGTTSHEYITKVIAQKFNITSWRAAAIIQLQHNEEQMRRDHPELLSEDQANYAEEQIKQNIQDAYRSERLQAPNQFVEDPVGAHGRGEPDETSYNWKRTDDIFDLEKKLEEANTRDAKDARLILDGHIYQEDVDESTIPVKTDGNVVRKLFKNKDRLKATTAKVQTDIPYPETNGNGEKRERWKYVAQVVDTRLLRKKGRRIQTYKNGSTENTLVEHDGELRVATKEEAYEVAWKQKRDDNTYVTKGAKEAWVQKMKYGKTDAWGRAPITKAPQPPQKEQKEKEAANEENTKEDEEVVAAAAADDDVAAASEETAVDAAAADESTSAEPETDNAEKAPAQPEKEATETEAGDSKK